MTHQFGMVLKMVAAHQQERRRIGACQLSMGHSQKLSGFQDFQTLSFFEDGLFDFSLVFKCLTKATMFSQISKSWTATKK